MLRLFNNIGLTARLNACRLLCLALLTCLAMPVMAVDSSVLVVLSKENKHYQTFSNGIETGLEGHVSLEIKVKVVLLSDLKHQGHVREDGKPYNFIITAGSHAARTVARLNVKSPVLCTLIPRRTFDKIRTEFSRATRNFSAIYIDQPVERRLDLIRAALPEYRNVGVVLGPTTEKHHNELIKAARAKNIHLDSKKIESTSGLLDALNEVLDNSDVLLTIADPDVVNRSTLQSVFMTSYMKRIPVIAYSRAYVRAGALMAVYSTPAQVGFEVAKTLAGLIEARQHKFGAPRYPVSYSVAVNERVARSLGIYMKKESQILSVMQAMEKGL